LEPDFEDEPLGRDVQSAARQLTGLTFRTLLVACGAFVCGALGLWLLSSPLHAVSGWVLGAMAQQGNLPLADVPAGVLAENLLSVPEAAFLLISVLAVGGFSMGKFGRTSILVVMVPPLLAGAVSIYAAPPSVHWMYLLPSKLERDIMLGQYSVVDEILSRPATNPEFAQYVRAQEALWKGDQKALRTYGEPVLEAADQWAYGLRASGEWQFPEVIQFRPEVIYAIDVALNGQPLTHVGLKWSEEQGVRGNVGSSISTLLMLGLALSLLVASIVQLAMWNGMRLRIGAIRHELERESVRLDASRDGYDGDEIAAADPAAIPPLPLRKSEPASRHDDASMGKHDAVGFKALPVDVEFAAGLLSPPEPLIASASPAKWFAPHFNSRKIVVLAAIIGGAVWMYRHYVGVSSPWYGPTDTHPCDFVGDWQIRFADASSLARFKDSGEFEILSGNLRGGDRRTGVWQVQGDVLSFIGTDPMADYRGRGSYRIARVSARTIRLEHWNYKDAIVTYTRAGAARSLRCW
jgi:hypothetical protein